MKFESRIEGFSVLDPPGSGCVATCGRRSREALRSSFGVLLAESGFQRPVLRGDSEPQDSSQGTGEVLVLKVLQGLE